MRKLLIKIIGIVLILISFTNLHNLVLNPTSNFIFLDIFLNLSIICIGLYVLIYNITADG